jgi:hypothetical protein
VIGLRVTAASKKGKEKNLNLPAHVSVNYLYLPTEFINISDFKKQNFKGKCVASANLRSSGLFMWQKLTALWQQ